jgi:hypothetical protein
LRCCCWSRLARTQSKEIVVAVIDILIRPEGGTLVLFNCRATPLCRDHEARSERAIAHSLAAADAENSPPQ